MRPSRGMGAMRTSKMPKAKTVTRKDDPDKVTMYAKGGDVKESDKSDLSQDKALVKKAVRQHETAQHGGKHSELKLKKGGKTWIKEAIKKPGALRASLGAKKGEPIPAKKLASAAKKPGKLGQRARFAMVLKGFKKK